jgi:hypothetical protein
VVNVSCPEGKRNAYRNQKLMKFGREIHVDDDQKSNEMVFSFIFGHLRNWWGGNFKWQFYVNGGSILHCVLEGSLGRIL